MNRPTTDYTPPPTDFGLPPKFSEWRDGQDALFLDMVDCDRRFSIHSSPVGSGKSPAAMAAALAGGARVAYLTESKPLQDQVNADFASVGVFDMRGMGNYTCQALAKGGHLEQMWTKHWGRPTCDVGPCGSGLRCDLKNLGCDYFDAYRVACGSQIVLTNYAYWIAIHKYGQGLGKFEWLILDEAHSALSCLSNALSVEFAPKDFKQLGTVPLKYGAPMQNWRMWARVQASRISGKLEFYAQSAQIGQTVNPDGTLLLVRDTDLPDANELRYWKRMEAKCSMLGDSTDDWVCEQDESSGNIRIAPAWVHQYAESCLFLNIPRVILMSGTIRPKTADLLGIPEDQRRFTEYPSSFPIERRPIYWIPTVRLNIHSTESDLRTWVVRIDQILARRLDRKGIIHTRSFAQQQFLLTHSRYRHIMHANKTGTTRDVVRAFRNSEPPAVLVSPSVGTGFDFPDDAARFQIISKLPFCDPRGAIIRAQAKSDPDYMNYLTAQELTQQYGRPNRSKSDFSETLIIDDSIEWFLKRYRRFFPTYFLEAFEPVYGVPDPPPLGRYPG